MISDDELVRDAHTYAREIMKNVGLDRAAFLDELDPGAYLAWAHTVAFEFSRLMVVSIISCGVPDRVWEHFFSAMAQQSRQHLHPALKAEGVRQARKAAAKIDPPSEGVVN
jgi:hypothetical protein